MWGPSDYRRDRSTSNGCRELGGGRMYQPIRRDGEALDRTIVVTFAERDPEAYVFTFG
jgi:hypothetical protein